jgi:hypothetical protein
MALVTFSRVSAPVASFSPTTNPVYGGYVRRKQWLAGADLSDGGDPYSYAHGELAARVLRWTKMKAADLTNLLAFVSAISGGRYAFTFTDTDGTSFTNSRIMNDGAIEWRDVGAGRYEVTLEIEVA